MSNVGLRLRLIRPTELRSCKDESWDFGRSQETRLDMVNRHFEINTVSEPGEALVPAVAGGPSGKGRPWRPRLGPCTHGADCRTRHASRRDRMPHDGHLGIGCGAYPRRTHPTAARMDGALRRSARPCRRPGKPATPARGRAPRRPDGKLRSRRPSTVQAATKHAGRNRADHARREHRSRAVRPGDRAARPEHARRGQRHRAGDRPASPPFTRCLPRTLRRRTRTSRR